MYQETTVIASLKSFPICKERRGIYNFTTYLEYFTLDLTSSQRLSFNLKDQNATTINDDAILMLAVQSL